MRNKTILIKRLDHARDIPIPSRASLGSSGFDLRAAISDEVVLAPGAFTMISTGFCFEIPMGMEVQVRSRSGLAAKHGIMVLNSPGTVDSDYRGEVKVILINLGSEPYTIHPGERIAQAVPMMVPVEAVFVEVPELSSSERGDGGFGSSGRH